MQSVELLKIFQVLERCLESVCEYFKNSKDIYFGTYVAGGHPPLMLHSNHEKKRCSHVLHSSPGKVVYFATSTISFEERVGFKVVTTVDDSYTFQHTLVFSVHRKCHYH